MRKRNGQALVEFALILPILMFTILGATEVGFLLVTKAHQDRETAVVADWAANHPGESWNSIATKLLPGCTVTVEEDRGLVEAGSRCQYSPKVMPGLFPNLPISSHETASAPGKGNPEPTPVASPSSS